MLHSFWLRIKKRRQLDRDLRDELDHHLEMRKQGSRVPFGNATLLQEQLRDQWSFAWIESLWRDLRHSARVLLRAPGHTAAIVVLLGLGIGANAAMFTLFNAVYIRPLAVVRPNELVIVNRTVGDYAGSWSDQRLDEFKNRQTSFSDLIAMGNFSGVLSLSADSTEPLGDARPTLASGNFFQTLGVRAAIGRVFTPADDDPAHPNQVIVLSEGFWRRFLGSDPNVVGRTLYYSRRPLTIIGVTPKEFVGLGETAWIPRALTVIKPDQTWATVIGRLKPGVSIQQAQAEATVLNAQIPMEPARPGQPQFTYGIRLNPGSRGLGRIEKQYGTSLQVLMATVALLLLMTCANVGSLLLARAGSRQRETAVRLALGCGRSRLIRQFLVESLVLSAGGCAIGLAFASWSIRGLVAVVIPVQALPVDVSLDTNVFLFTFGAACLCAILFGLGPALRASSVGIEPALKSASQTTTGPRSRYLLNRFFASAQVALSVVLVAGSALFGRSLYQIYSTSGFNGQNVISIGLAARFRYSDFAQTEDLGQRLTTRLSALPGVKLVSIVSQGLMNSWTAAVPGAEGSPKGPPHTEVVSSNFLDLLGIPVIKGRGFRPEDRKGAPLVSVVNQTFARAYFPGDDAVGKTFTVPPNYSDPITIIGIVSDAKLSNLRQSPVPTAFATFEQFPSYFGSLLVKVDGHASSVLPLMRSAIAEVDSTVRIYQLDTLDNVLNRSISRDLLLTRFTSMFGALALGLACFGIYGVISYLVVSKTTEIGIRLAIGAQQGQVLRKVITDALTTVAPGLILGIGIAMSAERLISSLLFGYRARDPWTYGGVAACLLLTTAFAAFLPAKRAAEIDPVDALRCE